MAKPAEKQSGSLLHRAIFLLVSALITVYVCGHLSAVINAGGLTVDNWTTILPEHIKATPFDFLHCNPYVAYFAVLLYILFFVMTLGKRELPQAEMKGEEHGSNDFQTDAERNLFLTNNTTPIYSLDLQEFKTPEKKEHKPIKLTIPKKAEPKDNIEVIVLDDAPADKKTAPILPIKTPAPDNTADNPSEPATADPAETTETAEAPAEATEVPTETEATEARTTEAPTETTETETADDTAEQIEPDQEQPQPKGKETADDENEENHGESDQCSGQDRQRKQYAPLAKCQNIIQHLAHRAGIS